MFGNDARILRAAFFPGPRRSTFGSTVRRTPWRRVGRGLEYVPAHDGASLWRRVLRWHPPWLVASVGGAAVALAGAVLAAYLTNTALFAPGPPEQSRAVAAHDIVQSVVLVGAVGGQVCSSGATVQQLSPTPLPPVTLTTKETCKDVGPPVPKQKERKLRSLYHQAENAYAAGRWAEARRTYEAMLSIMRTLCTSPEDMLCQIIAHYDTRNGTVPS